jgi:F-type H+-transporting ATPase subunit epsilon
MTLRFTLVSPEHILFDQDVTMVVVPGVEGDIGVLPHHAPLLTLLRPGVVSIYEGEQVLLKLFIDGGFCEVTPGKCTALVTTGAPLESLSKAALEMEIKTLLEEREDGSPLEEKKKAGQRLNIAQAKLMEVTVQKK